MVSENLINDLKLSSVVPAKITGEEDNMHELSNMDLSMKLHYIKTVHFFDREAAEGLSILDFKKPMFEWLDLYYPICGRIRRHEGRPFIKCNDSGVRIVEANCTSKTVGEWLESMDGGDHFRFLVYNQPLAHDLGFVPLVFLQFTKFKCGGLCVGMSWAHILGDAFSATNCINSWGKIMANQTTLPPHFLKPQSVVETSTFSPRSVKLLDPLGDNWLTPNNTKMQMHTFHLEDIQHLMSNLMASKDESKFEPFHVISAIIWKSLAKIRGIDNPSEPNIVTIVSNKTFDSDKIIIGNTHQVIGVVEAQGVKDVDTLELAKLIAEKFVEETGILEKQIVNENENRDVVLYGANLTFVNLEQVDLHGLQMKGRGPLFANLSIGGVGDEGGVFVLSSGQENGRIVNVIVPEDQLQDLKNQLQVEWGIL